MYRRIARMALVAVIGIAALGYGTLEKRLTVVIEGRPIAVRTFAPDVGSALQRAGISVAADDRVLPDLDTSIAEGDRIRVFRAKHLTLTVDGKRRKVLVTSLRVQGALAEAGITDIHPKDIIKPDPHTKLKDGMKIRYRPADRVVVRVDGKRLRHVTSVPRVKGVLQELKLKIGPLDRVSPPLNSKIDPDGVIKITRVRRTHKTEQQRIPFKTVYKKTRELEYGRRKVASQGRNGIRQVRYRVTLVDGEASSRERVGEKIVRRPQDRVILVGTSFPGCYCDNGVQRGGASWYSQADGLTAAHKTLPFGTVVRVENLDNGKYVNVVIRDRGPYIEGRIIDLSDEAFRRLAPLSSGVFPARIRW
ncbi:MAG: ubiquitin-like domain-containing protein [Actinomycetota bacterium]